MADFRIKDLTGTATIPATDDYTILDGASSGTRKINLKGQLDLKANDSAVVHATGDETVAGVKIFSSAPVASTKSMTDYVDKRFITDAQQTIINNTSGINTGDGIVYLGTCTTAAATAAKVVTLGITALTNGLTFLVSMTNANTSATITFDVDSLGAKNVYNKRGVQITGALFNNTANEKVLLRYNSALDGFELLTADFWSARMGMPSGSYIDLTLGASDSTYTAPADGYLKFITLPCTTVGYQYIGIEGGFEAESRTTYVNSRCIVSAPMKKGQIATYAYDTAGTRYFKFIYAEGSKP